MEFRLPSLPEAIQTLQQTAYGSDWLWGFKDGLELMCELLEEFEDRDWVIQQVQQRLAIIAEHRI